MSVHLKIDRHSKQPLHMQVELLLRQLIQQPDYQKGKLLPKETDLSRELGISRNTVRQAINKLVYEGLLVRTKRLGTRVRLSRVSTNLENWYSFTQEMTEQGIPFKNYETVAQLEPATEDLAEFFKLKAGQPLLKLSRLRGLENGPVVYFVSYFNPAIGLSVEDNFDQPLYDLLEKKYRIVPMVSDEELSIDLADQVLARKLKVSVGEPLMFRKRKVYDRDGQRIEFNLGWYRADRFVYRIKINRGKKSGSQPS